MSAVSEVAYLSRALKAPRIRQTAETLAKQAREEGWDYEAYLAAVLAEEVSARERPTAGSTGCAIAHFPQVKTLDDFDFAFQRSVKREEVDAPCPARLPQGEEEHHLPRATGDGEDASLHRSCRAGGQTRLPGALRDCPGVGDADWPRPRSRTASTRSSNGWGASRCSSWTRWATSPSIRRPPPSSSLWSLPATNEAR